MSLKRRHEKVNISQSMVKLIEADSMLTFLADERKLKRNGGPQEAAPRKKARR